MKAIGESKSKQEEDRIIVDEVATLKKRMPEQSTSKKKMKEMLVRLIYVEMLGHDGSFGYMKAVELAASTNLLQKRVGYLTASLVLSPEHEFRFMLVRGCRRPARVRRLSFHSVRPRAPRYSLAPGWIMNTPLCSLPRPRRRPHRYHPLDQRPARIDLA